MNNQNSLKFLQEYASAKRDEKIENRWYDNNNNEIKFYSQSPNEELKLIGPFSEEEAFKKRDIMKNHKALSKHIDKRLYNKRFELGDFEVTVTYKETFKIRNTYDNDSSYNSSGYKYITGEYNYEFGVYVGYHGHYKTLLRVFDTQLINTAYCKPEQTNWHWLKPNKNKPYIMKNISFYLNQDGVSMATKFLDSLDIDSLELKDAIIEPQYQYNFTLDGEKRPYVKEIHKHTEEEIDIEWFVKQEIKDGVYRPEGSTIAKWIYDGYRKGKYDKKLLQKLGVHTIQLRADAHFNPAAYYDLKGIVIKAPKTVIERYSLEKYCKSKDIVEKIKKEKKQREDEYKAQKYNSKFTLMQHGKVIKSEVDYHDIIEYLENFVPSSTMSKAHASESDVKREILKGAQVIFDEYKDLDKIYIAYWGTYYKYELRGEKKEFTCDCEYLNEHINPETYSQIIDLYESELLSGVDEKAITNMFGWPDRGGIAFGVRRVKDKLEVFSEDYDFE